MRCPDCNKFVSFDTDTEPELEASVDNDGNVTVETHIVNNCAECSTELKSGDFTIEIDMTKQVAEHKESCKECQGSDKDLEVEAEGTRNDRRQTHDRNGKPIKNSRYQRQYYGAEVTVEVEMPCGEKLSGTGQDEIQAGSMEECC